MKVGFALLTDPPTHNTVRKLAWQLHQDYCTGLRASRLPPHISLKQPFAIEALDLPVVERYFDRFAAQIAPFVVSLPGMRVITEPATPDLSGIVWLDVAETPLLRELHNQLNCDLATIFDDASTPFDGDSYQFHLTVAISSQPTDAYHRIAAQLQKSNLALSYTVREIALFVYDEVAPGEMDCLAYKIASLAGLNPYAPSTSRPVHVA